MQRSGIGSSRLRPLRAAAVAATTLIVASVALSGSPAYAINPPGVDPGAVPPNSPPGPPQPMRQTAYCTEVGVLPGTDFRVQPKYMDMLNLPEAWRFGRGAGVRVAVIDTGVAPHPRLPHLMPGGDYVMAGGDGLSDCDAHGTIVASMIGPHRQTAAGPGEPGPRRPPPVPTREPPPPAPPPQTISVAPPPPQTITMVPAPPPAPSEEAPRRVRRPPARRPRSCRRRQQGPRPPARPTTATARQYCPASPAAGTDRWSPSTTRGRPRRRRWTRRRRRCRLTHSAASPPTST